MKRLVVVDTSVRVLYHSILVFSLYFLFAGHNQPGGGFVGGLTAGAAVSFRYVAGGVGEVRRAFPVRPAVILGGGLLIATVTAIVPILLGQSVLEHAAVEADLPLIGAVKATSALPFDIGVYFVVLGLVLMMFEAFGDDVAPTEAGVEVSVADAMAADAVAGTPMEAGVEVPVSDGKVSDAMSADAMAADAMSADGMADDSAGTARGVEPPSHDGGAHR